MYIYTRTPVFLVVQLYYVIKLLLLVFYGFVLLLMQTINQL